jgi:hypothetical protein
MVKPNESGTIDRNERERGNAPLVPYFIVCCAVAGLFIWLANSTSSAFLEAELAACTANCSPARARLEATRQELVHQKRTRHASAYQLPECTCLR